MRPGNKRVFMSPNLRKPPWLKRKIPAAGQFGSVARTLNDLCLHTVCQEAHCPNMGECYGEGTATFLLLGPSCTRNCAFCAVEPSKPAPISPAEPKNTADAVARMELDFCVLTMVTRDDLPDGGAAHVAETIREIKSARPGLGVEVLISDLKGSHEALKTVLAVQPEVLNHNVETVPRLYKTVRPQADYRQSLEVIARASQYPRRPVTKSGIMVGLGESMEEILEVMKDLRNADCDLLTIGQYLAPSSKHHPVVRYVPPEEFEELAREADKMGFKACASGPYVRSSYKAAAMFKKAESHYSEPN